MEVGTGATAWVYYRAREMVRSLRNKVTRWETTLQALLLVTLTVMAPPTWSSRIGTKEQSAFCSTKGTIDTFSVCSPSSFTPGRAASPSLIAASCYDPSTGCQTAPRLLRSSPLDP